MKKCLCLLLALIFILAACGTESARPPYDFSNEDTSYAGEYMSDPEGLDPSLVLQMRKDYMQQQLDWYWEHYDNEAYKHYEEIIHLKDICVGSYLGTYSGYEVVYIAWSKRVVNGAENYEEIAGYGITFGGGDLPHVYRNSKFIDIKEAFEAGYISGEDIGAIKKIISPNILDPADILLIKDAFCDYILSEYPNKEWEKDSISISRYIKMRYGDAIMLYMSIGNNPLEAGDSAVEIAGYKLRPEPLAILYLYKDSKVYSIADAYEAELITKEDVYNIGMYEVGFVR